MSAHPTAPGCPSTAAEHVCSVHRQGQSTFLRSVPSEALEGYKIQFFGEGLTQETSEQLKDIADSRKIRIETHGRVPMEKLVGFICRSKGSILYSRKDANPRV